VKKLFVIAFCATLFALGAGQISPAEQAALDRISAASLRGNLSFLASDALEGRNTRREVSTSRPSSLPRSSAAPAWSRLRKTAATSRPPNMPKLRRKPPTSR